MPFELESFTSDVVKELESELSSDPIALKHIRGLKVIDGLRARSWRRAIDRESRQFLFLSPEGGNPDYVVYYFFDGKRLLTILVRDTSLPKKKVQVVHNFVALKSIDEDLKNSISEAFSKHGKWGYGELFPDGSMDCLPGVEPIFSEENRL